MRSLSKSKLMAFRQCPKRMWLEIHRPELRDDDSATQASFHTGHMVGDIARRLYDPKGNGTLVDFKNGGMAAAFSLTAELLASSRPIFEAGFSAGGALAFADVMLPTREAGKRAWHMIEVKSSTSVKDYHHDDTAIQAFVARTAGVSLTKISLAHIDSNWTYTGKGDYAGLLKQVDLSAGAFGRTAEVADWIGRAQVTAARRTAPRGPTGSHCSTPYACGFMAHCKSSEPQAQHPVEWLPRVQAKALKAHIAMMAVTELKDVPDALLNETQLRVKRHTLADQVYFDAAGAEADLRAHKLPAYFLDFETITFAVPIWPGTRPFQQIPFQFSVHRLGRTGKLEPGAFLDVSGDDPSRGFAEALIGACGERGPVFVYNAGFETARIRELAERFPLLKAGLLAINERVVDLLPVARQRYYHPSQQGGWSIKTVLPAIAPDLSYAQLDGVQDGGMAMNAFREAIDAGTTATRKSQIERQLLDYCALDTFAMVRLWKFFSGRIDLRL